MDVNVSIFWVVAVFSIPTLHTFHVSREKDTIMQVRAAKRLVLDHTISCATREWHNLSPVNTLQILALSSGKSD